MKKFSKVSSTEVFVRPVSGYLWSNDFARNRIGHLNILGVFHIVLGIIDMVAPLLIGDSVGFLVDGGMAFSKDYHVRLLNFFQWVDLVRTHTGFAYIPPLEGIKGVFIWSAWKP